MAKYLMQIVDEATGEVVQYLPGSTIEVDFVNDCTKRIVEAIKDLSALDPIKFASDAADNIAKRGVGMGRTTAHVTQDVKDGLHEVILSGGLADITHSVKNQVENCTHSAIESAILTLKKKVRPT